MLGTGGASEEAQRARDVTEAKATGKRKRRSKRKHVPQAEVPLEPERTIARPVRPSTVEDQVYEYLLKHGATSLSKIARDLDLDRSAVLVSLGALRKQGKVHLR